MQRSKAKLIVEKNYLGELPRHCMESSTNAPTLEEIEAFVSERNVGANAWRRTGVLTFDGNRSVKENVTYERIR